MRVAGFEPVVAIADEDLERENETKTSAVHFLRFEFTRADDRGAQGRRGAGGRRGLTRLSPQRRSAARALRVALLADFD